MDRPAPKRQRFAPPPIHIRPNRYRETRSILSARRTEAEQESSDDEGEPFDDHMCFEPHIIAMARERTTHPFIEINRPGPRTSRMVPVLERTYYPYPDMSPHINIPRVRRLVVVDLRTMAIASPAHSVPENFRAAYSVLAPTNSPRELVFPGVIWPNSFGPLDMPHVSARTLGQRLSEMRQVRQALRGFVEKVRHMLTPWQRAEAESPTVLVFSIEDRKLVGHQVDRDLFFRILHPTFNPLFTRDEATFLRGACYILRASRQEGVARSVDDLLRHPQMDEFLCIKLLGLGCLDREDREEEAIRALEKYEDMADGEGYEDEE